MVGPHWSQKRLGKTDDMPERLWERLQRNPGERSKYEFVKLIDLAEKGAPIKGSDVPIVDDPLECPICGFIAGNESKLRAHKNKIHA